MYQEPNCCSAQHYLNGRNYATYGRTSPENYAVGETVCNGVHGANRLASTLY